MHAVVGFLQSTIANMVWVRISAFALAFLAYQALAAPLQSATAPVKVTARSGIEDVELRPIARSSEKRDQINTLVPRSTTLHLDYIDGTLR